MTRLNVHCDLPKNIFLPSIAQLIIQSQLIFFGKIFTLQNKKKDVLTLPVAKSNSLIIFNRMKMIRKNSNIIIIIKKIFITTFWRSNSPKNLLDSCWAFNELNHSLLQMYSLFSVLVTLIWKWYKMSLFFQTSQAFLLKILAMY